MNAGNRLLDLRCLIGGARCDGNVLLRRLLLVGTRNLTARLRWRLGRIDGLL